MNITLPYLTRDRHFLLKGGEEWYAAHSRELRDYITPWGFPLGYVSVPGEGFVNGPVYPRVAIIDIDVDSGSLRPGAKRIRGCLWFCIDRDFFDREKDPVKLWLATENDTFIQVSCFATVVNTLQEMERHLGRQVEWAFDSPQLLIVPRAGKLQNAFYDRCSGSLQFFHFNVEDPGPVGGERTVYTALSHDIVSHETVHAVVDGLLPDLYNASSPESLGLHESYADLISMIENIGNQVYEASQRRVDVIKEFGEIAEEFGTVVRTDVEYLRSAINRRTLAPDDESVDELGIPNAVDITDPHRLSEVMTGAVYSSFARFFKGMRGDKFWRLWTAADFLPAVLIESLNYLPPGELSFLDAGRALLVSCEQAKQHSPAIFERYFTKCRGYDKVALVPKAERKKAAEALCDRFAWLLRDELCKRRIADDKRQLDVTPPDLRVDDATRKAIRSDPSRARLLVEQRRKAFSLPDAVEFTVNVVETRIRRLHCRTRNQILLRIRWERTEGHELEGGIGRQWAVPVGVTVVFDRDRQQAISALRTHMSGRRTTYRRRLLSHWASRGLLRPEGASTGPDGRPLHNTIRAVEREGITRVFDSARALHILSANE